MRYRLSIPLIALSLAAIGSPGCNQLDPADEPNNPAAAIPVPPPKAAEIAEPEPEAQGEKSVVLPGASVRGFETTQLMAKTGGSATG